MYHSVARALRNNHTTATVFSFPPEVPTKSLTLFQKEAPYRARSTHEIP